jgi:PAS domain S-box-containing protein
MSFRVIPGGYDFLRSLSAHGGTREVLELAVELAGLGIFENDLQRKRTRYSPELCEMLGIPTEAELPYQENGRFVHEDDRQAMRAAIKAAANSQGLWSGIYRLVRADGEVRWASIRGRRIYRTTRHGPVPIKSFGVVIDITGIMKKDEALRENELRLRFALEAAQMGTFEAKLDGTEAIVDAQAARLLGLPAGTRVVSPEVLRRQVASVDLNASDLKKERLTQSGEAYRHEFRFRLPDGSERWLSAHADIRDNRIFGLNFDITERKLAEARLQESEERLRIAAHSAELGVFEWHAETDTPIWENERIYEIFGRSPTDGPLNWRQFANYLHPDDAHQFSSAVKAARQGGGPLHIVTNFTRADGVHRWIQIDGKFHAASDGSRLIGVVADITERKLLEQRTRNLSRSLVTIQEEERQTIAQELHDSTVQHFVAASLMLMPLRGRGPLADAQARQWDEVERYLQEGLRELRSFSYLMHPPALQSTKLAATMRRYVEGYAQRTGINVDLRANAKADALPFELQRAVLRIVQEGLANIHRHAAATHAAIQLRFFRGRLHVTIKDNGRGLGPAPKAAFKFGRGLAGIDARARYHDGKLRIQGSAHGTVLHIMVPISTAERRFTSVEETTAQHSMETMRRVICDLDDTVTQARRC